MTDSLPFELHKYHKSNTKSQWRKQGMIFTQEDFEFIYEEYIHASNCDLCNKEFKSSQDRQLDHDHETGEVRNIVCNSCNQKRKDVKIQKNNTTGYKNIIVRKDTKKPRYIFQPKINKRTTHVKSSNDLDFLIKYRDKWIKDNNYYT